MRRIAASTFDARWTLAWAGFALTTLSIFLALDRSGQLAIAVLGAGLAIVVLTYWEVAFSLLVFLLIAGLNINFVGPDPVDFLLIPTVLLGFIYGHIQIRRVYFGKTLWVCIAAFALSFALSVLVGVPTWYLVGHFIRNLALFAFLLLYLNSRVRARIVFSGLLVGVFCTGIVSLFVASGVVTNDALLFPVMWGPRYQSLMGDPNMLGLNTLVILVWLLDETLRPNLWRNSRGLKVGLLLILSLQILATSSRSAWIGALTAIVVYAGLRVRWHDILRVSVGVVVKSLLAAAGITLLALVGLSYLGIENSVFRRATALQGGDNYGPELRRLQMEYTRHAIGIGLQHPLGVGPGQTEQTNSNDNPDDLRNAGAHNTYVQVLSDYGWLAFAAFSSILLLCSSRIYSLARARGEEIGLHFAWLLAALAGCAALAMFQDILFWPFPWILPGLAMAGLAANRERLKSLASV